MRRTFLIAAAVVMGFAVAPASAQYRELNLDVTKQDKVWSNSVTRGEALTFRVYLYKRGAVYTNNDLSGYVFIASNRTSGVGQMWNWSARGTGYVDFAATAAKTMGLSTNDTFPTSYVASVVLTNSTGTTVLRWAKGVMTHETDAAISGQAAAAATGIINCDVTTFTGALPWTNLTVVSTNFPVTGGLLTGGTSIGLTTSTVQGVVGGVLSTGTAYNANRLGDIVSTSYVTNDQTNVNLGALHLYNVLAARNEAILTPTNNADLFRINLEPGASVTGMMIGRPGSTVPPGANGSYMCYIRAPASGTYNHALGLESGKNNGEILHLYNDDQVHLARFNTDASDELDVIYSRVSGDYQMRWLGGADPYLMLSPTGALRTAGMLLDVDGAVRIRGALTVVGAFSGTNGLDTVAAREAAVAASTQTIAGASVSGTVPAATWASVAASATNLYALSATGLGTYYTQVTPERDADNGNSSVVITNEAGLRNIRFFLEDPNVDLDGVGEIYYADGGTWRWQMTSNTAWMKRNEGAGEIYSFGPNGNVVTNGAPLLTSLSNHVFSATTNMWGPIVWESYANAFTNCFVNFNEANTGVTVWVRGGAIGTATGAWYSATTWTNEPHGGTFVTSALLNASAAKIDLTNTFAAGTSLRFAITNGYAALSNTCYTVTGVVQ